jgi:hypothetical protein
MTLLAAYGVLLCRYTAQEEVIIGTHAANRSRPAMSKDKGVTARKLGSINSPRLPNSLSERALEVGFVQRHSAL